MVDFPNTPTEGDVYTEEGQTWVYRDGAWAVSANALDLTPVEIVESGTFEGDFWQVWGDVLIQWGRNTLTSFGAPNVGFPKVFKTTPSITAMPAEASDGWSVTAQSISVVGFVGQLWQTSDGAQLGSGSFDWIAVGEAPDDLKKPKSVGVVGGDGSEFVLKAGDTMSGNLRIAKSEFPSLNLATAEADVARFTVGYNHTDGSGFLNHYDAGADFVGGLVVTASGNVAINSSGANLYLNNTNSGGAANGHLWFQENSVDRGLLYYNQQTSVMQFNMYDATGGFLGSPLVMQPDNTCIVGNALSAFGIVLRSDGNFSSPFSATTQGASGSHYHEHNPGTVLAWGITPDNGTYFSHRSDGSGYAPVSWAIGSSIHVKENLRGITDGAALDAIAQLSGKTYERKDVTQIDGTAKTQHGLIAQDVKKVLPHAVTEDPARVGPNGEDIPEMMFYDPAAVVALLVESVKELTAKVEELEAQINGT